MTSQGGLVGKGDFQLNIDKSKGDFSTGRRVIRLTLDASSSVLVLSPRSRFAGLMRTLNKRIMGMSTASSGRLGTVSVSTTCNGRGGPLVRGSRFVLSMFRRLIKTKGLSTGRGSVLSHYTTSICQSCVQDNCAKRIPALGSVCQRLVLRPRRRTEKLTLSSRLFVGKDLGAFTRPAGIGGGGEVVSCSVQRLKRRLVPLKVLIALSDVFGEMVRG